jgi:ABC-2 type transport system ATP-binding protein
MDENNLRNLRVRNHEPCHAHAEFHVLFLEISGLCMGARATEAARSPDESVNTRTQTMELFLRSFFQPAFLPHLRMIEVKSLVKTYGAKRAVDGVTFTVRPGDILGFLGPNGAGKSTTMKMITGYIRPDAGTATVAGIDVTRDPVAVKSRVGYLPESAPAYGEMTVQEFLNFIAEVRGYRGAAERRERVERALARTHLEPVRRQVIETLSKGYKQRVGFAQALLHEPPCLVLDEPTDGLDPNQKNEVRALIKTMAADRAVILSTHILEEVDAICTRIILISQGRVVVDETPEVFHARKPGARLDTIFRDLTSTEA